MSFICPFPAGAPVTATYQGKVPSVLNGTFTLPISGQTLIVLSIQWQTAAVSGFGVTIGGHVSTIVVGGPLTSGNNAVLAAAFVSASDPNTWSVAGTTPFSSRAETYIYQIDGVSSINATGAVSGVPGDPGTISIPANCAVIASGNISSGGSTTCSVTGLIQDSTDAVSQHSYASGHDNFLVANPSQPVAVNGTNITALISCYAIFQA